MKAKKVLAAVLTLTMVFGAAGALVPESTIFSTDITASAKNENSGVTFNDKTGTLTLMGNFGAEALSGFRDQAGIKKIVAADNCILPETCMYLIDGRRTGGGSYWKDLEEIDLSKADASKVKDMSVMFLGLDKLKCIDLSGLDTSNLLYMTQMFGNCKNLKKIDLTGFDTSKVTDMSNVFVNLSSLTDLDVTSFNTSNVTSMHGMFSGCSSLTSIDLSNFDTSNVINMEMMFNGSAIQELDISSFDTSLVQNMAGMFHYCNKLKTVYVSDKWTTENLESKSSALFGYNVALVGGNGTKYDPYHVDATYACIDKSEHTGYFTDINDKPEFLLGDVNADGIVDIEDAVMVISHLNGSNALTADQEKRANVDGNSSIDIEDAVAIIAHVNGVNPLW